MADSGMVVFPMYVGVIPVTAFTTITRHNTSQKKIADNYQKLVKCGYSSKKSLGTMKTMLQASAASGEKLTDVVHNSMAAIEAFGLKSDDIRKIAANTKKSC